MEKQKNNQQSHADTLLTPSISCNRIEMIELLKIFHYFTQVVVFKFKICELIDVFLQVFMDYKLYALQLNAMKEMKKKTHAIITTMRNQYNIH